MCIISAEELEADRQRWLHVTKTNIFVSARTRVANLNFSGIGLKGNNRHSSSVATPATRV